MQDWTPQDIPWHTFDAAKSRPAIISLVKAAALVEHNGDDYADYLCRVFVDETELHPLFRQWAQEEVQHGQVLRRWAEMADPAFDFKASFAAFKDGYRLPLHGAASVRGSRSGELIARCIVEIGTSSYYTSIKDAVDEPVLKDICGRIAADEYRHYKMFFMLAKKYFARDRLNFWRRLSIALSRVAESEDDELAYAFHAAHWPERKYDHTLSKNLYLMRAFPLYRKNHIRRMTTMLLMAIEIKPRDWLGRTAAAMGWLALRARLHAAQMLHPVLSVHAKT